VRGELVRSAHSRRRAHIVAAVDAASVVGKLVELFKLSEPNASAMQALFHPDARLRTIVGGRDVVSTAAEAIARLEQASRDGWVVVRLAAPVALDEHAVTVRGRVRRTLAGGGFEDAGHCWTLSVVDGLIYRQGVYASASEAAAAYRELGICLGIVDVPTAEAPATADHAQEARRAKGLKPAPGEA
jgi:hypothetical protein